MTPQATPSLDRTVWTPTLEEALLVGLLERYSPSGAERQASAWASEHMRALGLQSAVDAVGNLIATLPATVSANEEQPPCVLLGHIDTVPGYIPVRREGDQLYGRGAVDAKGPLAAFLAAAARMAQHRTPRTRPLIVVGAVEEEAATSRGARAVQDRWRPAYAIIGEPSGADAMTLGYKGRLLLTCHVEQPVAHTARPEESACARAVAFWAMLQTEAAQWNRTHAAQGTPGEASPFAELMPSLRAIHSGSNGFVDWCELEIGYR
ncbi:MAG: M20/M25/M40 family metallo-hydrolase, partial [Ktedonobacterales bacterium]